MFVLVMITEPFLASILPSATAPEFIVMDESDKTFPLKDVKSPIVAELLTCQNTFLACAPPARITLPPEADGKGPEPTEVKEDPTWNIQTAFASPCASRVRSPFCNNIVDEDV